MHPNAVNALLSEPNGSILLVKRRGSVLWGLPGGDVRGSLPMEELLTIYCHRQTGVSPDFAGMFVEFTLAGKIIAVTTGTISKARAAARGRVEAVLWTLTTDLPMQIDPAVRMAIALLKRTVVNTPAALALES